MERKKYILLVGLLIISTTLFASYRDSIYNAYINNQMEDWERIIDKMERDKNNTTDNLLEIINYQYGYIGFCMGTNQNNKAKKYLKLAENNLAQLENKNYSPSEINAYKSAFYGFKIGLSPIKAPILGPKSISYSKLAMEQDGKNPMGFIQYGNSQFYMPPVFGGSKEEALEYFLKALELIELNKNQLANDWNYLSLLALIGQSYEAIGQYEKAKIFYEKALKAEPRFLWVKNELYPQLLKNKSIR
ncbi:MAG: tetratricopeptide repeat protein [Prolixibacteraceae bacterium]|nr:tetratricopeptide repeat protein [Prolixibacteraceae bacterium]